MNFAERLILRIAVLALLPVPAGAAPPPLPRGTEIRVNTDTQTSHHRPSAAAFPEGGFVVVWNAISDLGIRARFFDHQGQPASGEVPLKVNGLVDQVVADPDGSFLVVWTGFPPLRSVSNVYVRRFRRDGTPAGKTIRANALSRFDRCCAAAAVGPDGRFAVVWRALVPWSGPGGDYTDAVGRIFTASGVPVTEEITLLAGHPASPAGDDRQDAFPISLALAPDGTLTALVKKGPSCVLNALARVPPDGGPPTSQFLGSFCGNLDSSTGSLAMGLDGGLIAAWRDFEVYGQRFAADGTPRGDLVRVSAKPTEAQTDPVAALQAGGSFVVAWTEMEGRDGDGEGVYGRAFNPDGIPRSRDFLINTTTKGDQHHPAIAAPRRGPVLVVWTQDKNGRSDVFARVLAAKP